VPPTNNASHEYKKAISTEAFKEGMLTVQQKALAAKNMD
jgi:hypothetical protein